MTNSVFPQTLVRALQLPGDPGYPASKLIWLCLLFNLILCSSSLCLLYSIYLNLEIKFNSFPPRGLCTCCCCSEIHFFPLVLHVYLFLTLRSQFIWETSFDNPPRPYRHTSEILQVWFQTTAIKWLSRKNGLHEVFSFLVHIKVVFTLFSSVQSLSHIWLFVTPWTAARQASLSITNSWVHSNSRLLSRWCHPAISSSVVPFFCPQSLPASESFPMSQLRMRRPKYWSFSFSISPSKEHPGLISFRMDWLDLLAVQGTLSRVFSNTTVQKHQFFGAQLSWQSNSHIHTWPLEKP